MPSTLGRSIAFLIAASGVLVAIPRAPAQSYTVTPLGVLSPGDYLTASSINSSGQIAGTEHSADGSSCVGVIRGIGPTLAQFSVTGVLAQPVLTVFDSAGNAIATNTAWGTGTNVAQLSTAMAAVGALTLPTGSADSALLLSLKPGSYTAQVSGYNNSTGIALIDVYELPSAP